MVNGRFFAFEFKGALAMRFGPLSGDAPSKDDPSGLRPISKPRTTFPKLPSLSGVDSSDDGSVVNDFDRAFRDGFFKVKS